MISVVIKGPQFKDAHRQILQALEYADMVELRLDLFTDLDFEALKKLRAEFPIPMIFTLREKESLAALSELNPDYMDVEGGLIIPDHIKTIRSYHNYEKTPENLEEIYRNLQMHPATFYKIAVMANSLLDTLSLIRFAKNKEKLIAISMGPLGEISRILAPLLNSPLTFASLNSFETTAPGQLPAEILVKRYHYPSLNQKTQVFGLIGDPVDMSVSDVTHNNLIQTLEMNAVYVKIPVKPRELEAFLTFAKDFPFSGLSVTMPLKEAIIPFLDEIEPEAREIGAVNTLSFKEGKIIGFNTDGKGALNAIEKEYCVLGMHILILGAGGAAKAIAYEAIKRGAFVTIANRDLARAKELADKLNCKWTSLDGPKVSYDLLINCTPTCPIQKDNISSKSIVMDITTNPKDTEFLQAAKNQGCRILYGYQMFAEQAILQFEKWIKA